ncbi:MAG: TIGR01244 family phosphatase [Gammaproteobacteria bacterium]|nr:TIGR01244 family phosphatase [Gammaproteobacteria bacterium]
MTMIKLSENYAVAPQVFPDDVTRIAAEGFVVIICNRPDGEEPGQPTAAEVAAACENAGLAFHHIPISGVPVAQELIQEQHRLIETSTGPVLAYCRSGQRSQFIWEVSA